MHARTVVVVAVMVSLAFGLTGCMRPAPELTSEQVEAWQVKGEEMIPAATDVSIVTGHMQGMFGGGSNTMEVKVTFASFADLKDNVGAVNDLGAFLEEESGAFVDTSVINAGAGAFGEEVGNRLLDEVPGVEGALVDTEVWSYSDDGVPELWATAYVYVTDEEVVDPAWLDAVVDTTQQALDEEGGGSLVSINIFPAEIYERGPEGRTVGRYRFEVWALPGIRDVAESADCLRTGSWAYDITKRSATVYPVSEPGGACAPATGTD